MEKQVIFLFGQPGAGKGTQADILADKFGYYHFESSKVIEKCFASEGDDKVFEIDGKPYKVADERKLWETGILVSPPFVVMLFASRIKELAADGKSIIFSGSPRTVYEAEKLIPLLKELYGEASMKFVMLEASAQTTIFRNQNRRICELMRHPMLFSKETQQLTHCPLDGSLLVERKGLDDPDTIKTRLVEFKERTYPVAQIMEREGIPMHTINAEQTVAEVHADILKAIA